MKKVCSSLLLLFVVMHAGHARQSNVDPIRDQVFIGQAYPSGNVYLKPFAGDKWPKELTLIPLVSDPSARTLKAVFSNGGVPAAYIPAFEGMDDLHDPCGPREVKKLDPAFLYLSDDFFDAMVDHCEPTDGLAVYRSSPSGSSFKVLAVSPEISLADIRYATAERPMTPAERQEVAREKQEAGKASADFPCTTEPAFIDSARELVQAGIGNGLTMRVSFYENPGCAGHLMGVYVLDVLRDANLLTTFQLTQYQGNL